MFQQKAFIPALSTVAVIIFFFFYSLTSELEHKLETTLSEKQGLEELHTIYDLIALMQDFRGTSVLSTQTDISHKTLFSTQAQKIKQLIEEKLLLMNDQKLAKLIHQDIDHLPSNIDEKFNLISNIIERLHKKTVDISDESKLLYEDNRENYLLMRIAVQLTPNLSESAARIRGLSSFREMDKEAIAEEKALFTHYLNKIRSMSYLENENSAFENDVRDINTLYQKYTPMFLGNKTCTGLECYNEGSTLLSAIQNFGNTASRHLDMNLEKRAGELEKKIFLTYTALVISFLLIVSVIVFFYLRIRSIAASLQKEQNNFNFIDQMQTTLKEANRLKGVCDESLSYIANYYNASVAVMYLYNSKNNQLDLSATYGLNPKSLSYTLEIGEGIIGQNAIDQKIMEVTVEEFDEETIVETGTIIAKSKKVVTFPLLHLKNHIGNIQFVVLQESSIEHPFLSRISEMASGYIYKAIKAEESRKYLLAIDDHVITSTTNVQGIITEVSRAFEEISGYKKEELLGKKHNIVRHPEMPDTLFKDLWRTISKGNQWHGEIKNRKKDGGYYWVDVVITPNYNLYNKIIGYTAIRRDISDKKRVEEIAVTDGLTNIFNRRHFEDQFPKQLEMARRYHHHLVFALLDIDHFKLYNDTYGHQDGDAALKSVAHTLKKSLKRPDDMVFRLGGEEFGLLFSANTIDDAEKFILSVKEGVENLHIEHKHNSASPYVTISMGAVYINPKTEKTTQELYKTADEILYSSKEQGRNRAKIMAV